MVDLRFSISSPMVASFLFGWELTRLTIMDGKMGPE